MLVLASFVLGGLFLHILVLEWTESEAGAYLAGLGFLLAPWRMSLLYWPHLLNVQYLPLALLALDRTARRGRLGTALVAGGLITLQMLCSFYVAYMTAVVLGCWVVADLTVRGLRGRGRVWRAVAIALIVPSVALLVVSIPYATAHRRGELPSQWTSDLTAFATILGSPAKVCGVLARCGARRARARSWGARRARGRLQGRHPRPDVRTCNGCGVRNQPGSQGLLDGWLAPYRWLVAIVPGFSLARAPFRFAIVASLGASSLAGWGAAGIVRLLAGRPRALVWAVATSAVAVASLELGIATGQMRFTPLPVGDAVPQVYRWLASTETAGRCLSSPWSQVRSTAFLPPAWPRPWRCTSALTTGFQP